MKRKRVDKTRRTSTYNFDKVRLCQRKQLRQTEQKNTDKMSQSSSSSSSCFYLYVIFLFTVRNNRSLSLFSFFPSLVKSAKKLHNRAKKIQISIWLGNEHCFRLSFYSTKNTTIGNLLEMSVAFCFCFTDLGKLKLHMVVWF